MSGTIKKYYQLTKPGIIYGNALLVIGGFLLASQSSINLVRLAAVLVGASLVMAAACVFNNYLDRDIDAKMARTQKRALVKHSIEPKAALRFGAAVGLIGFAALIIFTNILTALVGLVGLVVYVGLYTPSKRRTSNSTVIGSISGAVPPVAGFTAASGSLNSGAVLLFLVLVAWQMPHFYSIAIYRRNDYEAAGLPVMPLKKGIHNAKVQIVLYTIGFAFGIGLLTLFGYTGLIFFAVMGTLASLWLRRGLQGFSTTDDVAWAKGMFKFSLTVITALAIMLMVGGRLP